MKAKVTKGMASRLATAEAALKTAKLGGVQGEIEAANGALSLLRYWSQSASESVLADYESGNVTTIYAGPCGDS